MVSVPDFVGSIVRTYISCSLIQQNLLNTCRPDGPPATKIAPSNQKYANWQLEFQILDHLMGLYV